MPISLRIAGRRYPAPASASQLVRGLWRRPRPHAQHPLFSTEAAPSGRGRAFEGKRRHEATSESAGQRQQQQPRPQQSAPQQGGRQQQQQQQQQQQEPRQHNQRQQLQQQQQQQQQQQPEGQRRQKWHERQEWRRVKGGHGGLEHLRKLTAAVTSRSSAQDVENLLQEMDSFRSRKIMLPPVVLHELLVACRRAGDYAASKRVLKTARSDEYKCTVGEYYGLITQAFDAGQYQDVVQLFEEMKAEGRVPDMPTYNKVASALRALADVEGVRALIEEMKQAGVPPDVYIHGALLGALAANRRLLEAFEYLQELQKSGEAQFQSAAPYRMLMMTLSDKGDWVGCLEVWADMKARGIVPDREVFKSLLYSLCLTDSKLKHRRRVLELTDEYAQLVEGRTSTLPRNLKPATLRTIMVAAWEEGDKKRAVAAAAELVRVKDRLDGNPLRVALMAALDSGNTHLAQAVGKAMKRRSSSGAGGESSLALDNQVLAALSGLGRWGELGQHYARMKAKDAQTYRTVASALLSQGRGEEAVALVDEALSAGKFDEKGVSSLLVLCQRKGQGALARRILAMAEGGMPDLPLWTHEMAAETCASSGDWQGAEAVVRAMQAKGLAPTDKLCNLLLYAYAQAGEVRKAADFLTEMEASGVELKPSNHNSLLLAHAKSGDWKGAFAALRLMSERSIKADLMSYNTVIKAAGAAGHVGFTMKILQLMEAEGMQPDIVTYNACILAAKNAGNWRHAKDLLAQARSRGLSPDLLSYNMVLEACAGAGRLDDCLALLQQLASEGLRPDTYTYFAALRVAVTQRRWPAAAQVLTRLRADRVDLKAENADLTVATLLCTKRRDEAERLVKRLHGSVAHDAWVRGLIYADCGAEAVQYVSTVAAEADDLPASSFEAAIHACRRVEDAETGCALFRALQQRQQQGVDVGCLTALAALYGQCQRWDDAIATLEQARGLGHRLNLSLYKSWLHSLNGKRDGAGSLAVLDDMRANGLQDTETFSVALRTLAEVGDMPGCEEVMRRFKASGLPPTPSLSHATLRHAVKSGGLRRCLARLREMKVQNWPLNVGAYNTVLSAACDERDWGRVSSTFDAMKLANLKPDALSYSLLINSLGHAGNLRGAIDAFNQMSRDGLTPLPATYTYLILACGRTDRFDLATAYFDEMEVRGLGPNIQAFNALISATAKAKGVAEAEKLLPQMRKQGIAPDTVSYNSLLDECGRRGYGVKAALVFNDMQAQGVQPDRTSYLLGIRAWGSSWPCLTYLYEEAKLRFGGSAQAGVQLHDLLLTALEQLQRDPQAFELVGRRAYQQAVAEGWVGHWGCERDKTFKAVDLHYYSRAMARCALADVLDEVVAGRGPLEQDKDSLRIVCGQNAGKATLIPEVLNFLQHLDPPLEALVSTMNSGRVYVDRVVFWQWVAARRRKMHSAAVERR